MFFRSVSLKKILYCYCKCELVGNITDHPLCFDIIIGLRGCSFYVSDDAFQRGQIIRTELQIISQGADT